MNHIVIIGAGYAGLTAALRLSRKAGPATSITLLNPSGTFVERIRLHEDAAGRGPRRHVIARWLEGTRVKFVERRVDRVDTMKREVFAGDQRFPYDALVLATGSMTDTSFPGVAQHALTVERFGALPKTGSVVIVGGGLTAIELATELKEASPAREVMLVSRGGFMTGFSPAAQTYTRTVLQRLGVACREHTAVERVEAHVLHTASGPIPFDACMWTAGFRASPLPAGLELPLNAQGRVKVDAFQRATPEVWVIGDAAEVDGRYPVPMGCKAAAPAAASAVDNLLRVQKGAPLQPFDYFAAGYCVSLGRREGFVQLAREDGSLQGAVIRGRVGAFVKELICRFTLWSLWLEKNGLSNYAAFKPRQPPSLPSKATA